MEIELLEPVLAFRGLSDEDDSDDVALNDDNEDLDLDEEETDGEEEADDEGMGESEM